MFVKHLTDCKEFVAGDGSILREILHPGKTNLRIRYSLAHAKVLPDQETKPHKLKSSEVYYIITGRGRMHINEDVFEVGPESTIYIPPSSIQSIENIGDSDLVFLCLVEPAWRKADEEVLAS